MPDGVSMRERVKMFTYKPTVKDFLEFVLIVCAWYVVIYGVLVLCGVGAAALAVALERLPEAIRDCPFCM